jgi:hypothetical protein
MNNIKSIIHIYRHGARTSSVIGRIEDIELAKMRKGLTPLGFLQLYNRGIEARADKFIRDMIDSGNVNVYMSDRTRVRDSTIAFIEGLLDAKKYNISKLKEELCFVNNLFESKRFCKVRKYSQIVNEFNSNLEEIRDISYFKNINFKTYDKQKANIKIQELDVNSSKEYKSLILEIHPFLAKLLFSDLTEGIFNFSKNECLDYKNFTSENLFQNDLKKIVDFIKCNKFYEDIPIYKIEYLDMIKKIKTFITNYSDSLLTEEIINNRISHIEDRIKQIQSNIIHSFEVFITHDTTIKSLLKYLLIKEPYDEIKQKIEDDNYFYILNPRFGSCLKVIIYTNNKWELYMDKTNLTNFTDLNKFNINNLI